MAGRSVRAATPKACAACPWRLSNQGQRHPHGFYSKRNLRRLWAGLRRGARMSCHPTDPRMADFSGYEHVADAAHTGECAGALIVVQREFMLFDRLCQQADAENKTDGLRRYRRARPFGMTRDGLVALAERAVFGGSQLDRIKMTRPELNDPDVGYPPLGDDWKQLL